MQTWETAPAKVARMLKIHTSGPLRLEGSKTAFRSLHSGPLRGAMFAQGGQKSSALRDVATFGPAQEVRKSAEGEVSS